MKTLLTLLTGTLLLSFATLEPIPRHNVYFAWNATELKSTSRQVIESVYAKLPAGQSVRLGIMGPISNAHNTAEKNQINSKRANSIVSFLHQLGTEKDKVEVEDVSNAFHINTSDVTTPKILVLEVLLTKAPGWIEPAFTSIDEFLPLPVQTFTINPREDNRLVGDQGTVINIPAFTLELRNGIVPSEMNVELTEVYGNGQIVQADLHTASGGRMLQSGGTIHLAANTNGKEAQVAQGKSLELEFPYGEDEPSENMEVFNGRVDRNGNFDWVQNGLMIERVPVVRETFYINEKPVSKEEYYASLQAWEERKAQREREIAEEERMNEIYNEVASNAEAMDAYLLASEELGWINCDEFYDIPNKTNVLVRVDTTYRPSVRMVFDNLSSVMNGNYNPRNGTVTFSDVPVGEPIRLVGYSIMDGTPYIANQSMSISENLNYDLQLTATTKKQMEVELAALN